MGRTGPQRPDPCHRIPVWVDDVTVDVVHPSGGVPLVQQRRRGFARRTRSSRINAASAQPLSLPILNVASARRALPSPAC